MMPIKDSIILFLLLFPLIIFTLIAEIITFYIENEEIKEEFSYIPDSRKKRHQIVLYRISQILFFGGLSVLSLIIFANEQSCKNIIGIIAACTIFPSLFMAFERESYVGEQMQSLSDNI